MIMRGLKNWLDYRFYHFCQIFKKSCPKIVSNLLKNQQIFMKISVYWPRMRLLLRRSARSSHSGRTSPPYAVATLIIFSPRVILKAA